jgi:hypothetical protein
MPDVDSGKVGATSWMVRVMVTRSGKVVRKQTGHFIIFFLLIAYVSIQGCARELPRPETPATGAAAGRRLIGYSVQAEAFSSMDHALRRVRCLRDAGEEAYLTVQESGFYGVIYGDFPSEAEAGKGAEYLGSRCALGEYRIIEPAVPEAAQLAALEGMLRGKIVETSKRFVGTSHRWGSSPPPGALDCSGLTAAVYRLNGLYLPRSSRQQWESLRHVETGEIKIGDLVFFSTAEKEKISHVGIYIGAGTFIHAPGSGKKIRFDLLSSEYFKPRFTGARTFF